MGVQWKYLWPVLVLAAALTLGLGAALRFLRPASLGERISVAEGASLRRGLCVSAAHGRRMPFYHEGGYDVFI